MLINFLLDPYPQNCLPDSLCPRIQPDPEPQHCLVLLVLRRNVFEGDGPWPPAVPRHGHCREHAGGAEWRGAGQTAPAHCPPGWPAPALQESHLQPPARRAQSLHC